MQILEEEYNVEKSCLMICDFGDEKYHPSVVSPHVPKDHLPTHLQGNSQL